MMMMMMMIIIIYKHIKDLKNLRMK